mgnify:CR=1 FL=1
MTPTIREYERIRAVLAEADTESLTAHEILTRLEERDVDVESAHRVATVLGRRAERGEIEVVHDDPYRYRLAG